MVPAPPGWALRGRLHPSGRARAAHDTHERPASFRRHLAFAITSRVAVNERARQSCSALDIEICDGFSE
jgi:hypothetical protein